MCQKGYVPLILTRIIISDTQTRDSKLTNQLELFARKKGCLKWVQQTNTPKNNPKAKYFTAEKLKNLQLNFDQCGFLHEEEEILSPDELIKNYKARRETLDREIDAKLQQICEILGIEA